MVELLKELLHQLSDVRALVALGGLVMVCGIIFVETGLFVGFFLPGDSLLVTAGVVAADKASGLQLALLLPLVTLCAIVGDQLGYWIGRTMGHGLYQREDSRFFKKSHLMRAHEFYEKYGSRTIILARFMPIVRTFCPPVAGAAQMNYTRYLLCDIVGGFLWVWSMILLGYTLGTHVPNIDKRIHYVIAIVIFLSLLPAIISAWRARTRKAPATLKEAKAAKVEVE